MAGGPSLAETLKKSLENFLKRYPGGNQEATAPVAPLLNGDTATPLQDLRDNPKTPQTPTTPPKAAGG